MPVFGAPVAFEDAPLRACRAALDILDQLKAAAPDLEAKHGVRPQLRIAIPRQIKRCRAPPGDRALSQSFASITKAKAPAVGPSL
jgi:hypothetical protein